MKKLILLSLMFSSTVLGDTATVTWNHPTTNTNGSTIPASGEGSLVSSRVVYGICTVVGTFNNAPSSLLVLYPTNSVEINSLAAGQWCFGVYSKNTYGSESLISAIVSKTIANTPTIPNPPVILTVATIAYEINSKGNLGSPIGTVALNVKCLGTEPLITKRGNTYYELSIDDVQLSKMPKSAIIVGLCAIT